MYVDTDTILELAALLAAFGTLGALLYKVFKWVERQKGTGRGD